LSLMNPAPYLKIHRMLFSPPPNQPVYPRPFTIMSVPGNCTNVLDLRREDGSPKYISGPKGQIFRNRTPLKTGRAS